MSAAITRKGDPSRWEKRWRRIEVISTIVLTVAGVLIAIFLGITQQRIANIGTQTAQRQALASLIIGLGDEEAKKRRQAAIGLAQFGKEAIPPLLLGLEDDDNEVQISTIKALIYIYKMKNAPEIVDNICTVLLENKNENAIEASIHILQEINYLELPQVICKLGMRSFRLAINKLKNDDAYDVLLKIIQDEDLSTENIEYTIRALEKFTVQQDKLVVNSLLKELKDGKHNYDVQVTLVQFLEKLLKEGKVDITSKDKIKKIFTEKLNSKSDRLRTHALVALKPYLEEKDIKIAIENVIKSDENKFLSSRKEAQDIIESYKPVRNTKVLK